MTTPTNPPAPPSSPAITPGIPLLAEATVLRRNGNARPVPGILSPVVLKVYGLVGDRISAVDLRTSAGMDDTALGAALGELVQRGLIIAEVVPAEDPLDLDFTSPEVIENLRAEAKKVQQAEEEARLRVETERKAKLQAEARVRAETEAKARADADAKVNAAALARLKAEKVVRNQSDDEIVARQGALDRAEAEVRARADALARAEAEARARAESVLKAETNAAARLAAVRRMEAGLKARIAALARLDAERKHKAIAEAKARDESTTLVRAGALAQAEAERKAREAAEQRAEAERVLRQQVEAKASAEAQARQDALAQAREAQAMEDRLRAEAGERALAEQAAREEAQAERRAREQAEAMAAAERNAREEVERRARAQADAERRAREQTQALIEAERSLREEAEARMRALSSTEREAREKAAAQAQAESDWQPLAGLKPTARPAPTAAAAPAAAATPAPAPAPTPVSAPRPVAPPAAAPSPVVDADVLARAARQAIEDAEVQSRLEQERFTRELEDQMARLTAEQTAAPASGGAGGESGRMSTPEEQIRAMRDAEARDRAEDFARQQMTGILKMEEKRAKEEEQRRLLAEEESKRRVREATEIANRARAEREKFERERERQRKLAEAEAQALARAKARAEQPRESRWKIYVAVMVLLAAVVVGLFEVLPFNTYLGRVEQAMSTALGEKVAIKSMHASLIPRPNIRLTDVVVGTGPGSATIASVHAVPTLSSLFTGPLKFESVQLSSVTMPPEFLPKLPDVVGMDGRDTLGFERISIRNLRLVTPNLELPQAEVEVVWDSTGRFNSASILVYSRRVSIVLTRAAEDIALRLSATDWQPLPGSSATIDQLKVNGIVTRNGLVASEVDAELYGGTAQGSLKVAWGADAPVATASGEFLLRRLDAAKFLPAMTVNVTASGLMDGNMKFSLQAPALRRLLDSPQVSTAFTLRRGWLSGIDLTRLLLDPTNRGGRTTFEEWTGVFAMSGSNYSLRQMRLTSGPMIASGAADIDAASALTGRINAQLTTGSGNAVRANFSLGGTLQKIEVGN